MNAIVIVNSQVTDQPEGVSPMPSTLGPVVCESALLILFFVFNTLTIFCRRLVVGTETTSLAQFSCQFDEERMDA